MPAGNQQRSSVLQHLLQVNCIKKTRSNIPDHAQYNIVLMTSHPFLHTFSLS